MRSFVLLTFCFVLVYCRSENDNRRQLGERDRSRQDRENGRGVESVIGNSFERTTESSYNRENNNRGSSGQSFGSRPGESNQFSNSRETSGQNSQARPHGNSEKQFESRPGSQGISGRPVQESTDFRGTQEGNNFSGRPQESTFGQSSGFKPEGGRPTQGSSSSSGFRPTNEGQSGRPTQGFGSSSPGGFKPSNEGTFGRPNEESTSSQSSGFRPGNEGQSGRPTHGSSFGSFGGSNEGRPNEESTFGQSNVLRPSNAGQSGRPTQGSELGGSSGFRPGSEGQSGRPTHGSSFGSFGGSNEGRPNEGSTFGQSSGFRPGNEGQSGRPTQGSGFSSGGGSRPDNEGHLSGRPNEGSMFGRPSEGHSSGRPSENTSFGSFGGSRPEKEGHTAGRPTQGSQIGGTNGLRPTNEGQFSGRPESGIGQSTHEGQTSTITQRPSDKEPQQPEREQTQDGKEDDKDVCFTHIGCFKMGKPWKSTLRPVGAPHPPEKIQTVVHFYSRQNPKQPQNITVYPTVNMGRAQFDPKKISAIIVHGFSNSGNATWMKQMKDVYLRKVDANVMIVDWGKGAQLLNYLQVAGNTRVVGKQLGTFVKYLIENYGADPGRFHLIGHSLGAQICSYLAKDVPGIARLTALDPAQPGFEGFSKEVRLDQTDAEFVDVIHTDARPFIPTLGFGMMAPHGHVDFYMNGGFDQPGCLPPPKKDLPNIKSFLDFAKFPVETISKAVACPHARAYEYLIEAFNETDNCIFWGHKTDVKNVFKTVTNTVTQGLFKKFTALSTTCSKDDCIPLGFATKKSPLRGAFVVTTSGRSPYCISEPGVPPETLPQERKEKSFLQKVKETPILG